LCNAYFLSLQAAEDIEEINNRISSYNLEAANRILRSITQKFESLASFPNMGRRRDDLVVGLRSFPVEDYLIFYLPIEGGIEVARGYRDLEALFADDDEN